MLLPLVVMVLMEMYGGRTMASASEPDHNTGELFKRLYDFGLGKRAAYSYVSEYKRLPVYNFGLGKRSPGDERKLYSFGIGKRDYESDDDYDEEMPTEEIAGKRMKQYSFGIGKRLKPYSFGLGKRPAGKMYSFGLGKRSPYSDYDSRLFVEQNNEPNIFNDDDDVSEGVKRSNMNGHRFSFGLGKRLQAGARGDDRSRQGRSMHYNFGLGKRSQADTETTRAAVVN